MNKLMSVLQDHRKQCVEDLHKAEGCCEEKTIKVKIAALSELGMCEDAYVD